jgi:CBS domain-containing protein
MSVGRICVREVWVASPEESVATAARRMAEHDVGTLVVVDEHRHPLGMLTDRDVTLRCVAAGRPPPPTPGAAGI